MRPTKIESMKNVFKASDFSAKPNVMFRQVVQIQIAFPLRAFPRILHLLGWEICSKEFNTFRKGCIEVEEDFDMNVMSDIRAQH